MSKEVVEGINEIEKIMESLWFDTPRERTVNLWTGREGAILAEIQLFKTVYPERLEDDIRKEVEAKIWEDGMYQIGGEPYIKYLGLWDNEHADGIFGAKVRGLYYIEEWRGGCRVRYKIVTEQEYNELRDKNVANIDNLFPRNID